MKSVISFCVIGVLYCTLNSCSLSWRAESVMHQLYAGQYSLMAVMFLCCIFIISALLDKKESADTSCPDKDTQA